MNRVSTLYHTTSLDKKEVRKLHKTIIPTLLSGMEYMKNFPLSIVFGSKVLKRLQLIHTTATRIWGVLKHIRSNTKTGKKFLTLIIWVQLSMGTKNILEGLRDLTHVESKWTKGLIGDVQMIDCKMHLVQKCIPKPCHDNDQYTMKIILDSPHISK